MPLVQELALIAFPEHVAISPPPNAVRLMPSWNHAIPTPYCKPGYTHDFKLARGIGGLLICAHCETAGWVWPAMSGRA